MRGANNAAERAVRPICLGKKNWLSAGAKAGAQTLACAITLIESAKMNGLDPQAYIANLLIASTITRSTGSTNSCPGIGRY